MLLVRLVFTLFFLVSSAAAVHFSRPKEVRAKDASWVATVRLRHNGNGVCDGTLHAMKYVITSMDCVQTYHEDDIYVTFQAKKGADNVNVTKIWKNPQYKIQISRESGLAVLQLDRQPRPLTDKLYPRELARADHQDTKVDSAVVYARSGSKLYAMNVLIVDTAQCKRLYDAIALGMVTDRMVCAKNAAATCVNGGNGLISNGRLIGVFMYQYAKNFDCSKYPMVYVRMDDPANRKFIQDIVKQDLPYWYDGKP